jgi:hypothetical protein
MTAISSQHENALKRGWTERLSPSARVVKSGVMAEGCILLMPLGAR